MKERCDRYVELLKVNQHTLEQVMALAYIEVYGSEENKWEAFLSLIDRVRFLNKEKGKLKNKRSRIYESVKVIEGDVNAPRFSTFKKTFRRVIDNMFGAILGEGFSLELCSTKDEQGNIDYAISDGDIFFLVYLFATSTNADGRALVNEKYDEVSFEYYDNIKSGALSFLQNHPSDKFTSGYVEKRFNVTFGLYKRKILEKYRTMRDIVTEIANLEFNKYIDGFECQSCIEILNLCEDALVKLRCVMFSGDDDLRALVNSLYDETQQKIAKRLEEARSKEEKLQEESRKKARLAKDSSIGSSDLQEDKQSFVYIV